MKNSCIILETQPWIQYLIQASHDYAQGHIKIAYEDRFGEDATAHFPPLQVLDFTRAMDILAAIAVETISNYSPYLKPQELVADSIAKALTQVTTVTNRERALAEHFMSHELIDHVTMDFHAYVAKFVMSATHNKWDVVRDGLSLFLLCGDDYRIELYEQSQAPDDVSLPLGGVVNYIQGKAAKWFLQDAQMLPYRELILEALQDKFLYWRFPDYQGLPWQLLSAFPQHQMDQLRLNVIQEAMDSYFQIMIAPRLRANTFYEVSLTPNYTLILHATETPPAQAFIECELLRASIERGDYVSPRERQRLHDLERQYAP